jgi:hypothetical protein
MKGKWVNVTVPVASVILSLLTIEVGLRAYTGGWEYENLRDPSKADYIFRTPVAFDAELGWVPRGDAQAKNTILDDGTRSNGNGEVRDASKPILAVGDSFTFGTDVSDWETWPAQLEELSGIRVINAGVVAYDMDQAFLRARRLLRRYRFSTVIFGFIPDDVRYSQMWGWVKPYFDFKDGQLTLENVPIPPPSKKSDLLIALEHSQVVHSVMKRLFPTWWLDGSIQMQDGEKGLEVTCAMLQDLEKLTKTFGSQLIVFIEYHDGSFSSTAVEGKVRRVLNCLSDPATRVFDLKPALSELKAKDMSRYSGLNMPPQRWAHMTAAGNRFVALEILKILTHGSTQADRAVLSPVH